MDESMSSMVKLIGPIVVSSLADWPEMALIVGGSLTAFTVTVNEVEAEARDASVTVTVMVARPD